MLVEFILVFSVIKQKRRFMLVKTFLTIKVYCNYKQRYLFAGEGESLFVQVFCGWREVTRPHTNKGPANRFSG
jgi:hypothetical protein